MKNTLTELPKPFMVLAPMDDVTETVFRQIVAGCAAPDLFFTEFVNVEALCSPGRDSAMRRLVFTDKEKPIIAQIWGKNPDNFRKVASELVDMGFAGVDLNFGCPDKKVVRNGTGGGMIKYPDGAREIIQATKEGLDGRLPLSVKTRIGLKEYDEAWIKLLLEQNLDMLTIHLRTVKDMSKVPARWSEYAQRIRQLRDEISPNTLLVGNGDVLSRAQSEELANEYGYDGIMIARGIFRDPYVFAKSSPWKDFSPQQKIDLYKKHLKLFGDTYQTGERSFDTIKKFCKIYINNFSGASELRAKLMNARTVEESLTLLQN
jgi:tRNA-dihydrouridine synthase